MQPIFTLISTWRRPILLVAGLLLPLLAGCNPGGDGGGPY
jgi:hypothetical protein